MNYGELKQTVADYMHRVDLGDDIPGFIELARTRINRDLRVREMLTQAVVTPTGNPFPVEAGFLEMRGIHHEASNRRISLRMVGREQINFYRRNNGNEVRPKFYSIDGLEIETAPGGEGVEFTQIFYIEETEFVDDSDTRLTLDQYPTIWLYASLIEGHSFTQDLTLNAEATNFYTSELQIANQRAAETEGGPAIVIQGASQWI